MKHLNNDQRRGIFLNRLALWLKKNLKRKFILRIIYWMLKIAWWFSSDSFEEPRDFFGKQLAEATKNTEK